MREKQLLDEMTEIAEAARGLPEARVRRLIQWIRENMCPNLPEPGSARRGSPDPAETADRKVSSAAGRPSVASVARSGDRPQRSGLARSGDRPQRSGVARSGDRPQHAPAEWNDIRVIFFTEYDDTKTYLNQQLSPLIEGTERGPERIAVYHGPTPPAQRKEIQRAFQADPAKHPVRILIATDAAREGLNLQAHCWNLFHFDVPWNPSRMEQRNGRIDRKLQEADTVYCHYFVYKQRPEDRILRVLVRKTETIRKELGSLSEVIDARLADALKLGIRRDRIDALARDIESAGLDPETRSTVDAELEARMRGRPN